MQTRLQSFIESVVNISIGYMIAVITQLIVFPLYGIETRISTNLQIGAIFTVISIIRSYFVRRTFNFLHSPKGIRNTA